MALLTIVQRVHLGEIKVFQLCRLGYWVVYNRDFSNLQTFLSLIPCPITTFSTICETKHRSIHLSKISNMKYTHITVNVGAAEKYYKAICINPDEFKDVILNLGIFISVENFLLTVGLNRCYIRQECVQWVE